MTVIAFDGRFVAADRRMIIGSEIDREPCTKLVIVDNQVFAGTGYIHGKRRDRLISDVIAGNPLSALCEKVGELLRFNADGTVEVWTEGDPFSHPERAPCAFSSGGEYATGAMIAGKNAMEAVEIACKLDITCGGGVEFIDLSDLAKGVQSWLPKGTGGAAERERQPRVMLKPRKRAPDAQDGGYWEDDCIGSLVLGTGCGYCLRCNREWWVHVKTRCGDIGPKAAEPLTELPITPEMIEDAKARASVVALPSPIDQLKAHVRAWNNAAAKGDLKTTAQIDRKLMAFAFPPGVALAIDNDLASGHPVRRIIGGDG